MQTADRTRNRRPFLALLSGNIASDVGNDIAFVAIPWFVLQTTGSAAQTGIVVTATILAVVIAGFFGGAIVDRIGFRRMSVIADIASGLTIALIPLLFHTVGLPFEALVALVFLGAILDAPGRLARVSMLPDLAKLADTSLERANSAVQGTRSGVTVLTPILTGILVVAIGASNVLWFTTAGFAFSAFVVAAFVSPVSKPPVEKPAQSSSYVAEVRGGLRFLFNDRLLIGMTLAVAAAILVTRSFSRLIIPVYADEVFADAVNLGIMFAVQGGAVLAGIALFGAIGSRLPRRATFIAAFAIGGIPLWLLAGTPGLIVTLILLAVWGISLGPLNPLTVTILHERVPERLRGRVFGAYDATTTLVAPVGVLVSGVLIEQIGLSSTLVVLAIVFTAPAIVAFIHPSFRSMDTVKSEPVSPNVTTEPARQTHELGQPRCHSTSAS